MKMSAYTPVPFPSPVVSKANKQILRAKRTLRGYLGEVSTVQYVQ